MANERTRNLTIRVNADLYRDVKVIAAQRDTSISALVTKKLLDIVNEQSEFAEAKATALHYLEQGFDLGTAGEVSWSRDELHER